MEKTHGYGMGPDYRIHTYDKVYDYHYSPYNSTYSYDKVHDYEHVHTYDKIHEYNTVRNYDHVHECRYREYKPNINKSENPPKLKRQWTRVQTEVVYYKDVWPQLVLCYQMPMGPDIKLKEYVVEEYTPSEMKFSNFSGSDIKTDCAKYMDQPYHEYNGSVEYKLTAVNYHPFKSYNFHKQRQTRTVMVKKYTDKNKDENHNVVVSEEKPSDSVVVAPVVVPPPQTPKPDRWRTLTPHDTPSPDITPVEVAAIVIASPVPSRKTKSPEPEVVREKTPAFMPIAAVVPLQKDNTLNEIPESTKEKSISDSESGKHINDSQSHNSVPVDGVAAGAVIAGGATAAVTTSNKDPSVKSEEKEEEPYSNVPNNDSEDRDTPTGLVFGPAILVASRDTPEIRSSHSSPTKDIDSPQQGESEGSRKSGSPNLQPDPVIVGPVTHTEPQTSTANDQEPPKPEPANEDTQPKSPDVAVKPVPVVAVVASNPVTETESSAPTNKSTLPPEVIATIEAYDYAHTELQ